MGARLIGSSGQACSHTEAKRRDDPAGDGRDGDSEVRRLFGLDDLGPSKAAECFRHMVGLENLKTVAES